MKSGTSFRMRIAKGKARSYYITTKRWDQCTSKKQIPMKNGIEGWTFKELPRDSFLKRKGKKKEDKKNRKESRIYPIESEVTNDERSQQWNEITPDQPGDGDLEDQGLFLLYGLLGRNAPERVLFLYPEQARHSDHGSGPDRPAGQPHRISLEKAGEMW